jgi:O-antigen/teichoic acid export membrane protein
MSRLVALLALVWLAVAAAGGEIIRWLANERFHAAADYVPYIAGGVFFYGVLHLANTGLLLAKRLSWAALWWLAGGVVCGLLNLALAPSYGGMGAAVTQTASFAFVSIGILSTSQAKFRIYLDWSRLAMVMLIVVTAGMLLAPPWHGMPPLSLLLKLPIAIAVAAMVIFLIAHDWCIKGISYLRAPSVARSLPPKQS